MKVELHLHTSRHSACSADTPPDLMRKLIDAGYEAVFITEHDAVWPDEAIADLQAAHPDIRIFPGVELTISSLRSFQHLVVLGTSDPAYLGLAGSSPPDVASILAKARAEGHLTVLAHPCRWDGANDMVQRGFMPDALELRTCNQDARQADVARGIARRFDLRTVNAGDVHSREMVGHFWIEAARPLERPTDVREIVLAGEYANCAAGEGPRPG